jgi:hypothetical protein
LLDPINVSLNKASSSGSYSIKNGKLKIYDLQFEKNDTITIAAVNRYDFGSEELITIASDSMYTYRASGVQYTGASNDLRADNLWIHPNYNEYEFTSKSAFQVTRVDARFSNVFCHGFSGEGLLKSNNLICKLIEIEKLEIDAFRDQRKEIEHVNKTTFQDLIYQYQGTIRVDTLSVLNGDVIYTVHAPEAAEPGKISFNNLHANISNISNDAIYKTDTAYLELHGDALIMDKGKLTVLLKARIFDPLNTFMLLGNLSGMDADQLNPILAKNAFTYAQSGKIDAMNFEFSANNERATGALTLLYHGLDFAVKNKQTNDTTAFRERAISYIVNWKVIDSNPPPGQKIRVGIIDYVRDPERFLFGYCFRSILTGIKTSLLKQPQKLMAKNNSKK